MAKIKGITVEIGGNTTNLDKALTDVNKTISTTQKELKTVDRLSKLDPRNLSNYVEKQKALREAVDATKEKLETLQKASKQVEQQFKDGKISRQQYLDFQTELTRTKNNLKDLEGQTLSVNGALKKMGDVAVGSGKVLGQALVASVKAVAVAGVAAATAIVKLTQSAGAAADEINTLSAQTGLSTNTLQKFQFASETIDVSMETLTGSMARLTMNLGLAQKGTGNAYDAFNKLGVSIYDTNGELKNNEQLFNETITALGKVENGTQRDVYAMQLFGRSAMELNPLIKGGAEVLEEMGNAAEEAGLILSDEMLRSLNDVQDAQDLFNSTLKASGNVLAVAFAPAITEITNKLTGFVNKLSQAYSEEGLGGVTKAVGEIVSEMLTMFAEAIPQVLDMGANILTSLIDGIISDPQKLIDTIIGIVLKIIEIATNLFPKITEMGGRLIVALITGIAQAVPKLLTGVLDLMTATYGSFFKQLPKMLEIGKQIVIGIWEGIKAMASWLYDKVAGFFSNIVNGAKKALGISSPSKIFADVIGKNMALGVGEGFIGQMSAVKGAIGTSLASTSSVNINMNNSFSGGSYSARDGGKIARELNRSLGMAYR